MSDYGKLALLLGILLTTLIVVNKFFADTEQKKDIKIIIYIFGALAALVMVLGLFENV